MTDIWLNLLFNIATVVDFLWRSTVTALQRLPEGLIFYGLLHGSVWLIMKVYKREPVSMTNKNKRRSKTAVSAVETSHVNVHSLFN